MSLVAQCAQDEAPGVSLRRSLDGLVSVPLHQLVGEILLTEHFAVRVISAMGRCNEYSDIQNGVDITCTH